MDVSGYKFQSVAVNVSGQTTKVAVRSVTMETQRREKDPVAFSIQDTIWQRWINLSSLVNAIMNWRYENTDVN